MTIREKGTTFPPFRYHLATPRHGDCDCDSVLRGAHKTCIVVEMDVKLSFLVSLLPSFDKE